MLNFLRNFFKKLFGGGSATDLGPQAGTMRPPQTEEVEDKEADTSPAESSAGLLVEINRISPGTKDTLGELSLNGEFICYTLENPVSNSGVANESRAIPAGTYPLNLKKEGGKHATYQYRFGDVHKGLLLIDDVPGFEFPHIHIGNEISHTYGSIVLGTSKEGESAESFRKVLYSEKAYLDLYNKLVPHLEGGEKVSVKID
ncbi:MAG: DUF5675 family protein [Bacteroidota bacterium]